MRGATSTHPKTPTRRMTPADPTNPIQREWRNDATESRTNARAMLAPGSVHAPHLSALA